MLPVAHAISVKRRRLAFKGPPPTAYAALRAECFSEADLAALRLDARRFHIHYTHIRTTDRAHEKPGFFLTVFLRVVEVLGHH